MGAGAHDPAVSAREREVLALVARHLSNGEIADELVVSVRTVESHVSSLLRKLAATSRRELARRAGSVLAEPRGVPSDWPVELTSFVGRESEIAELTTAVGAHRLVTVVGPGGAGKTRLAVAVARSVETQRRGGAWFVDLVRVSDPRMVVVAVAATVGVPEQQGRSLADAVAADLAGGDALLVLDNCEHLLDAVRALVDRLVSACPSVTVLATSRARLATAYEQVFPVAGLPVTGRGDDAVRLFLDRSAAAGSREPPGADGAVRLCEVLGGLPLAIELAAARYPALGVDGILLGLEDGLGALRNGAAAGGRHGSMRDTIAWSYRLLDSDEQALLGTVSAFASWFDVDAAVAVAGNGSRATVADRLGRLAEQHLLVAAPGEPTRYRALELIRQFSAEQLAVLGRADAVHARHRQWCRAALGRLVAEVPDEPWCQAVDTVAADAQAAVVWAERRADDAVSGDAVSDDALPDDAVSGVAEPLAAVLLLRGRPAESQARYEQAARHTPTPLERGRLLRLAAGAAATRMVGNDALRLMRAAAEDALAGGDRAQAALDLAWCSIWTAQAPGIIAELPTPQEDRRTLARARLLALGSPAATAAVETAVASRLAGSGADELDATNRAADLARAAGAALVESAAQDSRCARYLAQHDFAGALAALGRRGEVLDALPLDAASAFQVNDYLLMASEVHLAVGDLASARAYADRLADLTCYREQHHLGLSRRIKVEALAGDLDAAAASGERFLASWVAAGRPLASNLAPTTYSLATVHALLGDERESEQWVEATRWLVADRPQQRIESCLSGWATFLDALVALDRGLPEVAYARLAVDLDDAEVWFRWNTALWRPWYAALWAEAAVLAGTSDALGRIQRAREAAAANPVATAILDRASDLARGDRSGMKRHAETFGALGCGYQERRSLALLGR